LIWAEFGLIELKQVEKRNLQRLRYSRKAQNGDVSAARLDSTDEGAVQPAAKRELLLAPRLGSSMNAHPCAEAAQDRVGALRHAQMLTAS
jgi:hypothetical protein